MPGKVDVVVVGAGLSGLQAAHDLHAAGFSVLVLEAKDRIGGKTWSHSTVTGGTVDLGGAWINDTNQSKMYALAQRFGLDLVQQNGLGRDIHQLAHGSIKVVPYGASKYPEEEETRKINDFVVHIDAGGRDLNLLDPHMYESYKDLDSMTVKEYCQRHLPGNISLELAEDTCAAFLGFNADEISALYLMDYVRAGGGLEIMWSDLRDGGQYLRVRSGTQSFSKGLAQALPPSSILLSHSVSSIVQPQPKSLGTNGDDDLLCIVTSAAASFSVSCRKVIVSVPTPLYRHITFDPPLPPAISTVAANSKLGYYAKMILIYAEPWWRLPPLNLSGVSASAIGPVSFTRDTSSPPTVSNPEQGGQHSLTCFLVGDLGRAWSQLSSTERQRRVAHQIEAMFGPAINAAHSSFPSSHSSSTDTTTSTTTLHNPPQPVQVLEQEWIKEEWSEGAPCPAPALGALAEGAALAIRSPCGNVHFVGTETSDVWKGYMEGAVRSGERGAREVAEALLR